MIKRIFLIILLLIVTSGVNVMATTIPQQVKDAVTFIFIKSDSGKPIPNGTGFFVAIKNENAPNILNVYLVTAKHILLDKKTNSLFNSVYIRLNKKTGDSEVYEVPLHGPNALKVFDHNDPNVDIALIPMAPDPNIFDIRWIPEDMITTKEIFKKSKIREGDEVFFVGLFTPYYGSQRNYPITRFGKVALTTDEKIPWKDKEEPFKMLDLYLVELQSFGGNSGSPVFFYLDATREAGSIVIGPPKLLLAGVMKGSFLDAKEIKVVETSKIPISLENVGIAAVIPAYRLHEILFSDELKKSRSAVKKQTVQEKKGN